MVHDIRIGDVRIVRIASLVSLFLLFSFSILGQQATCVVTNTTPTVHAEGLAEQVGDISFNCSGGTGTLNALIVITLNTNITNRVDANGDVLTNSSMAGGVIVTGATIPQPAVLNSPKAISFPVVQFPGAGASFTISGIRAAVATIAASGTNPTITASVYASPVVLSPPGQSLFVGQSAPTLLSSVVNNGIPCTGSPATPPLPATIDFNGLLGAGTAYSTVRITSESLGTFVPKFTTSDFGVRFLVSLSGYGSNSQVYVPDVIVGNVSPITSAGAFGSLAGPGVYSPSNNQLLLVRVGGADSTGAGGTPFLTPVAATMSLSPTSVTQVPLANGGATVTYEVLSAPANVQVSAQIPVFVVVPPSTCPDTLQNTLSATLAPASTVSTPTQTDPIPRYLATTPASDCMLIGDCSATYFPILGVATTSISLSGNSQGKVQQSTTITVNNTGGSQMNFNVSITYQAAAGLSTANWLSANVAGGVVETGTFAPLIFAADPTLLLVPGTYQATATINAGSAGKAVLPVTFTVGPAAPPPPPAPAISGIVNSANFQAGAAVTVNSFVSIFGSNLGSKATPPSVTVTFNGATATVLYDGSGQINVLVPASLGSNVTTASVVATIDGVASNSFTVNLVPNAPAAFNPGIENQNYTVNTTSAPASVANSEIIQIFLTGLATVGTPAVTVNIGSTAITGSQITYAGAVTGVPGLEQVNARLPSTLAPGTAQLSICVPGAAGQQPICSGSVPVYLH